MSWYDVMLWYDDNDMLWYNDNDKFCYDDNDNNYMHDVYDIVIISNKRC